MWERDGLPSWIPEVKLCNTLIFQDNVSLMKIKHKFKLRGFLSFFFFSICTGTISSLPPLFLPQNFSGKVSAEYFPWTSDMHPYRKASHFCIVTVFCSYFWNNDTLIVISKLWLISVIWKHPWLGNSSELQKQILNHILFLHILYLDSNQIFY